MTGTDTGTAVNATSNEIFLGKRETSFGGAGRMTALAGAEEVCFAEQQLILPPHLQQL